MHSKAVLLASVIVFSSSFNRDSGAALASALHLAPGPGCNTGLATGDTARFTGVMVPSGWAFASDAPKPPGSLRLWSDPDGRVHYSESWVYDTVTYTWDGEVAFTEDGLPRSLVATRTRNGILGTSERLEHDGDSVVIVRDGRRMTERLARDVVRIPALRSAPVVLLLMQCALSRPGAQFQSKEFGTVRAREVATIALTSGSRSEPATLYVLASDSVSQLGAAWLQPQSHRLIAMRRAEGVMDLVTTGWENTLPQLVAAEARAALPPNGGQTCAGGLGVGSCAPSPFLDESCKDKVKTLTIPPGRSGGTITLSDSGYSLTSDGLGPYRHGSSNVRVMCCGAGGFLRFVAKLQGASRAVRVNLNRPVPGDIGVPLGVINVDGFWPGTFIPAGASYADELSFLYMSPDTTRFTGNIAVGESARGGVGLFFLLHGQHHVLVVDPSADGLDGPCRGDGGPASGRGTSVATISRPNATTWVVDVPPGSIGRLFDNHRENGRAINRGLYYVSLHLVVQQ